MGQVGNGTAFSLSSLQHLLGGACPSPKREVLIRGTSRCSCFWKALVLAISLTGNGDHVRQKVLDITRL